MLKTVYNTDNPFFYSLINIKVKKQLHLFEIKIVCNIFNISIFGAILCVKK